MAAHLHDAFTGVVDVTTPNVARMYDYVLGGTANFAADREAADQVIRHMPGVREGFLANRAFLARAVQYTAGVGVAQFLDIGSGLPTQENVHEVAQMITPRAHVVYVDHDPVVVAQAHQLLKGVRRTRIVQATMTDPASILDNPGVSRLIDFQRPVAVLMFCALHFLSDDDAHQLMAALRGRLQPGSYVALSHATPDGQPSQMGAAAKVYQETVAVTARPRSRDEVAGLLEGFVPVPPGIVSIDAWRPGTAIDGTADTLAYGAVALKP